MRVRPGSLRPEGVLATAWATPDQRVWTLTLREGVALPRRRAARRRRGRGQPRAPAPRARLPRPRRAARARTSSRSRSTGRTRRCSRRSRSPSSRCRARGGSRPGPSCRSAPGPSGWRPPGPGCVELVAFDGYWAGAPRTRRLLFRRFANEDALARALAAGEADVSAALGPERAAELRAHAGVTLDSQTGLNLIYLAVNNERSPFSDVRVRRALSQADRPRGARRARCSPGTPSRPSRRCRPPCCGHDTQRARADARPRRRAPAAGRRARAAGLRDDAHGLARAAALPARAAARRRAPARRPRAGRARRAAARGRDLDRARRASPRAATSTSRSSAGRPTPSTRTTS